MNPCITTCPAIVPTEDEEMPDASSAIPKIVPACACRCAPSWSATTSRSSPTSCNPLVWKTAADVASIAMLIAPAMPIAIMTSISSKRKILRRASSSTPTIRRCVSAECR